MNIGKIVLIGAATLYCASCTPEQRCAVEDFSLHKVEHRGGAAEKKAWNTGHDALIRGCAAQGVVLHPVK